MSTFFFKETTTPFDLLYKDFFKSDLDFQPAKQAKFSHPVDIFETSKGLHFEIACTGLKKEDVELKIEGDTLRIFYDKNSKTSDDKNPEHTYIHRGIAKSSFNLGYKIAPKFDLSSAEAVMEDGLLLINIPFAEDLKPKKLHIK
jgi:HSP20 family molecular chaperone IbpA